MCIYMVNYNFATVRGAKYCDQCVCISVCLSVCMSARVSQKPQSKFYQIFALLPVALSHPLTAMRDVM